MKYPEAMQAIATEKALSFLGLTARKNGSYLNFPCIDCGNESAIRYYGERKNVAYCSTCKAGTNIIAMAVKLKGIDFQEAKKLLVEKTATTEETIQEKLSLKYELEFTIDMEKEGLSKELCDTVGVGRPKGKTMLSGCIAFTIHNETGLKVAYYGIRISDRRPKFHQSFNPELYLFAYHVADKNEEVLVTTDMFSCLRHLAQGEQAICNFGLPYLSSRQMELLSPFPYITFEWLFTDKKDIMLNVAQNLKAYHRFV
ncbi:MAG: hypothetical protein A4E62_00555 [Syntrophorhabdus sp. PtaU1.Bin002]|nr:MAG: hypothetical protein A4E62_00555 [Syntrophorhabdus sp. PtaU1.Bin002]